jgi:hypothetical protein
MAYESKTAKAQKLMSNSRTIGGLGGYFGVPVAAGASATDQDPKRREDNRNKSTTR